MTSVVGRAALAATIAIAGASVAIAAAEPAAARDQCNVTWVGPAGGEWSTAANWSTHRVPGNVSIACLPPGASVVVAAGERVHALETVMTQSALQIDGTLSSRFSITDSDLSGAGTLTTQYEDNVLSGAQLSGQVTISAEFVTVKGARAMCGSQLSLCLSGASQFLGGIVTLTGAVIGGDTTARPAMTGALYLQGGNLKNRVEVDLDAGVVDGTTSAPRSTLRLDHWEQLSADGNLTAVIVRSTNSKLIVTRNIVSVTAGLVDLARGAVRTTDGSDALTGLTTVAAYGRLALLADVTPQGGVFTVEPGQATGAPPVKRLALIPPTTTTLHGSFVNHAATDVKGDIAADTVVTTVDLVVFDGVDLSAGNVDLAAGRTTVRGRPTIAGTNGIRVNSSLIGDVRSACATLGGDVTFTAAARAVTTLGAPAAGCAALYSVSGSAALAGTLVLSTQAGTPVGTTDVLVDAAGGISGRFAKVTGQSDGNGHHWVISYTASQVVATLVAD